MVMKIAIICSLFNIRNYVCVFSFCLVEPHSSSPSTPPVRTDTAISDVSSSSSSPSPSSSSSPCCGSPAILVRMVNRPPISAFNWSKFGRVKVSNERLFALEDFDAGDVITEFCGEIRRYDPDHTTIRDIQLPTTQGQSLIIRGIEHRREFKFGPSSGAHTILNVGSLANDARGSLDEDYTANNADRRFIKPAQCRVPVSRPFHKTGRNLPPVEELHRIFLVANTTIKKEKEVCAVGKLCAL